MAKWDIGTEILEGIREVKPCKSGHLQLKTRKLKNPAPTREIRWHLQLSQMAFASLMGD